MSCKQGLRDITAQIGYLLERIDPKDYEMPLDVLEGSSVGQHFRHIFDFYLCMARGAEAGIVDYANRDRNPLVEHDPVFARQAFWFYQEQMEQLDENQPLLLRSDFLNAGAENRPVYPTSVGREMTFVHDHAIHHLAIIKIGLQEMAPELTTIQDIGVAPSTIRFRAKESK